MGAINGILMGVYAVVRPEPKYEEKNESTPTPGAHLCQPEELRLTLAHKRSASEKQNPIPNPHSPLPNNWQLRYWIPIVTQTTIHRHATSNQYRYGEF